MLWYGIIWSCTCKLVEIDITMFHVMFDYHGIFII